MTKKDVAVDCIRFMWLLRRLNLKRTKQKKSAFQIVIFYCLFEGDECVPPTLVFFGEETLIPPTLFAGSTLIGDGVTN